MEGLFQMLEQKSLKVHLFVAQPLLCNASTLEKLKVRSAGLDSYFPATQNATKKINIPSEEGGRYRALNPMKACPLKDSQMPRSIPVTVIPLGRAGQSFGSRGPSASDGAPPATHRPATQLVGWEPGWLQVHQETQLVPGLPSQCASDSPDTGLCQRRKSLERSEGTTYLLI